MAKKTDNHNPKAKLDLRRYFLRKHHADGTASVLDCCQGSAKLWTVLRDEFEIASYWGVDVKLKKGRLKIDSVRILDQPGWSQNVIDVDTYGSPWKHWIALLKNITQPVICFLTRGSHSREPLNEFERLAIGITFPIPDAFWPKILEMDNAVRACSVNGLGYAKITEAVEAVSDGNARYIGVRLEPIKTADTQRQTEGQPKRKRTKKESAHV